MDTDFVNSPGSPRLLELPRKKRRPQDESDESSDFSSEVDRKDGDFTLVVNRGEHPHQAGLPAQLSSPWCHVP